MTPALPLTGITPGQFVDPTDPAIRRFERALFELAEAMGDLGVDTVRGPKDCFVVFGDETFDKLRTELVTRETIMGYFKRPNRKKVDPDLERWMVSGVQFGTLPAMMDAASRYAFWPAPPKGKPLGIRFSGQCPSRRTEQ